MEEDELLEPLPDLDGDDAEPHEGEDFGDGLAAELLEGSEEVGLDAETAASRAEDLADLLELPPDEEGQWAQDDASAAVDLGDLLDDDEAAPPPLTGEGERAEWEDHVDLDEAPPLGPEDGGELGLEEPHLDDDVEGDDEVDLPTLDPGGPGGRRGATV